MDERKRFILNGTDITNLVAPAGYTVGEKVVTGGNSATMADGRSFKDVAARIRTVELPLMPLTDAQLADLIYLLHLSLRAAEIEYFDPWEIFNGEVSGYVTMDATYSISDRKYRGIGADGNHYWTGIVISFEEYGSGYNFWTN